MAAGVLLLAVDAGGTSYAADVLPGFLLVGAGVGPMFVAISVAAMSDVPAEKSGLASGLMMTGHEIGAALGVADAHRGRRRPDHLDRADRRVPGRLPRRRRHPGRPVRARPCARSPAASPRPQQPDGHGGHGH